MLSPCVSFYNFPSKAESLNSIAYILHSTCFTREQVDNTFTVTIKFVVFVTPLCNETLKTSVLLTLRQV